MYASVCVCVVKKVVPLCSDFDSRSRLATFLTPTGWQNASRVYLWQVSVAAAIASEAIITQQVLQPATEIKTTGKRGKK